MFYSNRVVFEWNNDNNGSGQVWNDEEDSGLFPSSLDHQQPNINPSSPPDTLTIIVTGRTDTQMEDIDHNRTVHLFLLPSSWSPSSLAHTKDQSTSGESTWQSMIGATVNGTTLPWWTTSQRLSTSDASVRLTIEVKGASRSKLLNGTFDLFTLVVHRGGPNSQDEPQHSRPVLLYERLNLSHHITTTTTSLHGKLSGSCTEQIASRLQPVQIAMYSLLIKQLSNGR